MSSALTPQQEYALAAAVDELSANYEGVRSKWSLWLDNDAVDTTRAAVELAGRNIQLLRGDLLLAARGFLAWPLEEPGATIDPQGALGAWLNLADSVRGVLDGIKGYSSSWSALATLKGVSTSIANNLVVGSSALLIAALVIAGVVLFAKVAR